MKPIRAVAAFLIILALAVSPKAFAAETTPSQSKSAQPKTAKKKADAKPTPVPTPRPEAVEPDGIMGLYEGSGASAKVIGEWVRAAGQLRKNYRVVLSLDSPKIEVELKGTLEADSLPLTGTAGDVEWTGRLAAGKLSVSSKDGKSKVDLAPVVRKSPTLGQKPPEDAIVLLPFEEGKPTNLDAWKNKKWKILPDGSVEVSGGNNLTEREFGDCRLHLEFMTPYMPEARGQGRGNSGVYMQNRYETQILDSFGLPPKDNECGGIYEVAAPKINACLPPGQWQTYDITFHTHKFGPDGQPTEPAKLTVVHNGITIHENQPVMNATRAAGAKGAVKAGPLMLQDHGNPVRYRNIWLVELK